MLSLDDCLYALRPSKFAYAELHQEAGKMVAAVPYTIHTVLTDNSIHFTNHARHKYAFHHIFDRVCDENDIELRLTKITIRGPTAGSSG